MTDSFIGQVGDGITNKILKSYTCLAFFTLTSWLRKITQIEGWKIENKITWDKIIKILMKKIIEWWDFLANGKKKFFGRLRKARINNLITQKVVRGI